jgi:hypothetical protein
MLLAHVGKTASFPCRRDLENLPGPKESSLGEVLAQGRLHYGGQRRRRFLGCQVVLRRLGQVVGKGHGRTFHSVISSPIGSFGEA